MRNKLTLYIDQYGQRYYAMTVKELRRKIGGGGCRVWKMYQDEKGKSFHVGYVIGEHWLTAYHPHKIPA